MRDGMRVRKDAGILEGGLSPEGGRPPAEAMAPARRGAPGGKKSVESPFCIQQVTQIRPSVLRFVVANRFVLD